MSWTDAFSLPSAAVANRALDHSTWGLGSLFIAPTPTLAFLSHFPLFQEPQEDTDAQCGISRPQHRSKAVLTLSLLCQALEYCKELEKSRMRLLSPGPAGGSRETGPARPSAAPCWALACTASGSSATVNRP